MEIFKFGTDREDIGPLVSASLPIGRFFKPSTALSRAIPKSPTCQKMSEGHTKVQFRVQFVCISWPSQSHREAILSNWDYIVLPSCDHRHHRLGFATRS